MQYIYILESKSDNNLYVGCTNNLQNRVKLHNSGKVLSTNKRGPFKLIHYEAFLNRKDVFNREQFINQTGERSI